MILLLGCTPEPGTASGTLVDARGGAIGAAELRLTASLPECAPITVTTDAAGVWSAADLCGQATWTVAPVDPLWYLPQPVAAAIDTTIRVWRAPEGAGVYLVEGTNITTLTTNTVLDSVAVFGTTDLVQLPVEIPGALPRIEASRALLIVGPDPALAFSPLVASDRRVFGTKDAPVPVDPWVYLGVRFTGDTTFEPVTASVRPEGVQSVEGPRALRYVSADALPPGRYALPTTDGSKAWLLDFGPVTP